MAKFELILPKMGESIMEATILKWHKSVGDMVAEDETVLEVATDKVDSEVPSPVAGKIEELCFSENEVVAIGSVLARISTGAATDVSPGQSTEEVKKEDKAEVKKEVRKAAQVKAAAVEKPMSSVGRFYSPLVRSIAAKENISQSALDNIQGSGLNGRVTKADILGYLESGSGSRVSPATAVRTVPVSIGSDDEVVEMDRMRKLIADHMVMSKQVSPHVSTFVEVDVSRIVRWRNQNKGPFLQKHGEKLTFTPIFVQAIARAISDFPMINVSVDGQRIIVKKDINIGMAAALPSGNLIVPVIRNADQLSLVGLAKRVNDLAGRARINKLKPDEIQDGTFTLTNVGTFGNDMGTPIINQPQVAILATGVIKKKPVVIETDLGDQLAIRSMMYLSLSFDHRVVDGALGGSFLRRVGDYLEQFQGESI